MARADGGRLRRRTTVAVLLYYVYHTTTTIYVVPRRRHRSPPFIWRRRPPFLMFVRPSYEPRTASTVLFLLLASLWLLSKGCCCLVAKEPTVAHAIHDVDYFKTKLVHCRTISKKGTGINKTEHAAQSHAAAGQDYLNAEKMLRKC